jgi:hypothetical protein
MGDLTNEIPYQQYADEAYNRKNVIANNVATKAAKADKHLYGKAGAMGENVTFFPSKMSQETGEKAKDTLKNADAAYDKVQNIREEEMQDMQKRYELNTAKANAEKNKK